MSILIKEAVIRGTSFIGFSHGREKGPFFSSLRQPEGHPFPEKFYCATLREVNRAADLAETAFRLIRDRPVPDRAALLGSIADGIEQQKVEILERIHAETALTFTRLEGEMNRTLKQIRQFAALVRENNFGKPSSDRTPGALTDIRKHSIGIGPVVVFGAGNFPLAFSTLGTDTVSALAAGCPVIVKAHNGHPGSASMLASVIVRVLKKQNWPDGTFSLLFDRNNRVGQLLVRHPKIKAVGFTGSYTGGMSLFRTAMKRKNPIPVYAEMGSLNPVLLLPEMLAQLPDEWAAKLAASISQSCGQLCTRPGLLIGIQSPSLDRFQAILKSELARHEAQPMLNENTRDRYNRQIIETLISGKKAAEYFVCNSSEDKRSAQSILAIASASQFLSDPALSEELFGPYSLLVKCADRNELHRLIENLEGQLTFTLAGTQSELKKEKALIALASEKAGRVILNGVPTGVEVCAPMHHGGPSPASTFSQFTSVGTDAIGRFMRPVCFQNFTDDLLPTDVPGIRSPEKSERADGASMNGSN